MNVIKRVAKRAFPALYASLSHRIGYPARYSRVAEAVVGKYGRKVIEGPFAGMIYGEKVAGSAYTPKILGTYELEIQPWIKQIIQDDYQTIIDLGCAEGYYAVGLALRCPRTTIYAYDGDPEAQVACRELAALNGVEDRVKIGGYCEPETLKNLPLDHAMLICDVEGYEVELLDPEFIPVLATIDILAELHEPLVPGLTAKIISRFSPTHVITLLDAAPRDRTKHPNVHFLSPSDQDLALTESRPDGQQFALLRVRDTGVLHTDNRGSE
jgi:hypothetical protein